jgi:heme/copper-type cytochrome/quinol oxidase subunit 2
MSYRSESEIASQQAWYMSMWFMMMVVVVAAVVALVVWFGYMGPARS